MRNEKALVKNSIYYSASTLICMIVPLVIYPYITRILGPENYGKVSFAQNLITYFTILSTLGIRQYAQKVCAAAKDGSELARILKSLLVVAGTLTALALVGYIIAVLLLDVSLEEIWIYVFFSGMIIFSSLGMDWFVMAKECFAFVSVRNTITRLILPILAFVFIRHKSDYALYALVYTVSYSVLPAVLNYIHIVRKKLFSFGLIKSEKVELASHIGPIFFLSLVTIGSKIFSGMDIMMLGFLKDDTAVGIYTNAVKLPLVMDELLMAVAAVITPRLFMAVKNENMEEAKSLISYASNTMFFFAVPAILTCIFFSKELIYLIAGEEYISGYSILIIYSFIMITTLCLTLGGTRMFIAKGKEKQLFMFLLLAGVLNATLNYILIPKFGGAGAAIASIISNVCMFIAEATYIHSWGLIFDRDKLKYLISGAVLSLVFIILKLFLNINKPFYHLFISILIGGIFYALILLLLKENTVVRFLNSIKEFLKKVKKA